MSDALKALDKQMAQKLATRKKLDMSIAFQRTLMETLNQRVATRQEAIDKQVGTKINLYDAKEELERSQSQLASDEGQLIETDAALTELLSEKAKTTSQFIADNQNKLAEASRKADEARESVAKAAARAAHTRLTAPIDGVVQQTAVTTIGQVVTTGQELAAITPNGGKLQVEALVANLDIGFVKLGQPAVVKVDAFPFTRFGVLHGEVVKIASAAIPEEEAKRALANAASAANASQPPPTAPGQAESFVFPVTVALDETAMTIDNAVIPLTPGMTVTVEIKTDFRRVIDYLLSPSPGSPPRPAGRGKGSELQGERTPMVQSLLRVPLMAASIKVEISPGELVDKLTILEIKLQRIEDASKQANIAFEYRALRAAFDVQVEPSDAVQPLYDALRDVNIRLWDIENDIRECERRGDFGASFVALARAVYTNNDRRAELKRALNALLGSALVEEKSYSAY